MRRREADERKRVRLLREHGDDLTLRRLRQQGDVRRETGTEGNQAQRVVLQVRDSVGSLDEGCCAHQLSPQLDDERFGQSFLAAACDQTRENVVFALRSQRG